METPKKNRPAYATGFRSYRDGGLRDAAPGPCRHGHHVGRTRLPTNGSRSSTTATKSAHTRFPIPAATGLTRITTEIELVVKAFVFTVFNFKHRSEEIWRDARLMSLSSTTVEHGETLLVVGAATPLGFRIVTKTGPFIAPSDSLTSNSLWTPAVLDQDTVIDAQHGGVIGVSARKLADEDINPCRAPGSHHILPLHHALSRRHRLV